MTLEETTIRRSKRERREAKVWEPEIPVKTCRRHHETSKTTVTRRRSSAKGKESENGKGKLRVRVYCARMAVQTESSGPKTRTRRKASTTEQRRPATWEVGVSSSIDETYRENEGKLDEMATDAVLPGNRQVLNPRRTSSKKEGVRRSGSRPHGTLRHRKPEDGTRGVVDERDNDEREKRREETASSTASTTRDFEERREEKREREEKRDRLCIRSRKIQALYMQLGRRRPRG